MDTINQQPAEQEQKKPLLTLHITYKGQQKTLHFGVRHAVAVCAVAAVVVGGTAVSIGSYHKTKADLQSSEAQLLETERENRKLEQRAEALESENNDYNENIEAIRSKTSELEQKMTELEDMKNEIYEQMSTLTDSSSADTASVALMAHTETTPLFTSAVHTSYHKASALSANLDKMAALMEETGISLSAVADEVTYLAGQNNVPCGWPVESRIVSTEFNPTADPSISDGRKHEGMDISTQSQIIPIYATAGGTVITADFRSDYGYEVIIDHGNGYTTLYAHCNELLVNAGDKVKKGDMIAMTGSTGMSTGIHCHYEVKLDGVCQNPRDYLNE